MSKNIKALLFSYNHDELVMFLYMTLWKILQYKGWVTLNNENNSITVTNKGHYRLFHIALKLSPDDAEWIYKRTHNMPLNEQNDALIVNILFMKFIKLSWIEITKDNRLEFTYRGIDRMNRLLERLPDKELSPITNDAKKQG